MSWLSIVEKQMRRLAHALVLIGLTGLLLQATAITIDVLLRWIFNSPLFGMEDINQLLIAIILASFFPALLIDCNNITIDFLGRMLGPKTSAWFNVFGQLVTLLLFVVASWQLGVYATEVQSQTTLILRLPVSPSWWIATSLIVFCIPVQTVVVAVHLRSAVHGPAINSNMARQS